MTCEALVANRFGLAFAVDSAVTFGPENKSITHAEKLFEVGPGIPVAIADYGCAAYAGAPWPVIIDAWRTETNNQRFETLEGYRDSLVQFLESDHPVLALDDEAVNIGGIVEDYWRGAILQPVFTQYGELPLQWDSDAWQLLQSNLAADASLWRYGPMPGFGEDFASRVREKYRETLEERGSALFDGVLPPDEIWAEFLAIVDRIYTENWISSYSRSNLVFMGYGDAEYFPRYLDLALSPRVLGRVRSREIASQSIGKDCTGILQAFANTDSIDTYVGGINRPISGYLHSQLHRDYKSLAEELTAQGSHAEWFDAAERAEKLHGAFVDAVHREYELPLMRSVASLPLRPQAVLAHALVYLTAFRCTISCNNHGSVGGDVRVATISRDKGFHWMAV